MDTSFETAINMINEDHILSFITDNFLSRFTDFKEKAPSDRLVRFIYIMAIDNIKSENKLEAYDKAIKELDELTNQPISDYIEYRVENIMKMQMQEQE